MVQAYNGRTSVDGNSCSGLPSTTTTSDDIRRLRLAVKTDRFTLSNVESDLEIQKTSVWNIFIENLVMILMSAKFIPKSLTAEQNLRFEIVQDNREMFS